MLNVQLPAIVLLASAFLCQAKTIVVTNTNASGPGSLPDAVTSASSGDTITFNLTYPASIVLCGSVDIYTNIAIEGPGASQLALSEGMDCIASIVRVFGATVQISGLTIQNGGYPFAGFEEDGGISNNGGTVTVSKSMVSGNSTHSCGGGVSNGGTLTVIDSTLSGNYSDSVGGAICNGGTFTLINSTLSGNSALFDGGAIDSNGTFIMVNSTLSGNFVLFGGGINGNGGIYGLSGTLNLKNSILANNGGVNCSGTTVTSYGHNLSDDDTCGLTGPGDLTNTPAGLDPAGLQYNGGPTQTIALLPTSPAVNAIPLSPINYCTALDGVTPIATDQRGVLRPQGQACDMGAFELVPTVLCTGCYFFIQNERATFAFSSQQSTFSYHYRSSTVAVQFVSTVISQLSVVGNVATFSGQGALNGQSGYSFTIVATVGGAFGSDTVSINITGPSNYSYTANGTLAGGDIVVQP